MGCDVGERGQESGHVGHGMKFEFYFQCHRKSLKEFSSSII